MTFNGWKNYATWLVILAISSSDSMRDYWKSRAEEIRLHCETGFGSTDLEEGTARLAEALQAELTDGLIDIMPASSPLANMASDLMVAALGEVDWYEIAENQLEECLVAVS